MFIFFKRQKEKPLISTITRLIVFCLCLSLALGPTASYAQPMLTAGIELSGGAGFIPVPTLPLPGSMVPLSPSFQSTMIKGIKIFPDNPLRFDFIVDPGDSGLEGEVLKEESNKLIKYFLASLTVPEEDLWVNLSPYEKDRIIPDAFSVTEMGRDLLAQDYILKQITASLMYPEEDLGKEFWDRVYKKARQEFGTSEIPVNTFNKVWIVPQKAVVYENGDTAYVVDSYLKVMLEADYEASRYEMSDAESRAHGNREAGARDEAAKQSSAVSHQLSDGKLTTDDRKLKADTQEVSEKIIQEIIIPAIEKEVNEGKNFAQLRQIYHSVILATWFKQNLKESMLWKIYIDQNKVKGVDIEDKQAKEKIYQQYLEAFKTGVYNYIKEDIDPATNEIVPRKYFSGGTHLSSSPVLEVTHDPFKLDKSLTSSSLARTILLDPHKPISSPVSLSHPPSVLSPPLTTESRRLIAKESSSPISNDYKKNRVTAIRERLDEIQMTIGLNEDEKRQLVNDLSEEDDEESKRKNQKIDENLAKITELLVGLVEEKQSLTRELRRLGHIDQRSASPVNVSDQLPVISGQGEARATSDGAEGDRPSSRPSPQGMRRTSLPMNTPVTDSLPQSTKEKNYDDNQKIAIELVSMMIDTLFALGAPNNFKHVSEDMFKNQIQKYRELVEEILGEENYHVRLLAAALGWAKALKICKNIPKALESLKLSEDANGLPVEPMYIKHVIEKYLQYGVNPQDESLLRKYLQQYEDLVITDRDAYEVLGVNQSSSWNEIKNAYRRLAMKIHTDRNPHPNAGEKFKKVQSAREKLEKSHKPGPASSPASPEVSSPIDSDKSDVEKNGIDLRPEQIIIYYQQEGEPVSKERSIFSSIRLHPEFRGFELVSPTHKNIEGLTILTNNLSVINKYRANKLTIPEIYEVVVKGEVSPAIIKYMQEGIIPKGHRERGKRVFIENIVPESVEIMDSSEHATKIRFAFSEFAGHKISLLLDKFSLNVIRIKRVQMGRVALTNLSPGKFRRADWQELLAVSETYFGDRLEKDLLTLGSRRATEEIEDRHIVEDLLEDHQVINDVFRNIYRRFDLNYANIATEDIYYIGEGGFGRVYRAVIKIKNKTNKTEVFSFLIKVIKKDVKQSDSGYKYDAAYVSKFLDITKKAREKDLNLHPPVGGFYIRGNNDRIVITAGMVPEANLDRVSPSKKAQLEIETYLRYYQISDGKIFFFDPKPTNIIISQMKLMGYRGSLIDIDNILLGNISPNRLISNLFLFGYKVTDIIQSLIKVLGSKKALEIINMTVLIEGHGRSRLAEQLREAKEVFRDRLEEDIAPMPIKKSIMVRVNNMFLIIPENTTLLEVLYDSYTNFGEMVVKVNDQIISEDGKINLNFKEKRALFQRIVLEDNSVINFYPMEEGISEGSSGNEKTSADAIESLKNKRRILRSTIFDIDIKHLYDQLINFNERIKPLILRDGDERTKVNSFEHSFGALIIGIRDYLRRHQQSPLSDIQSDIILRRFQRIGLNDQRVRRDLVFELRRLLSEADELKRQHDAIMNLSADAVKYILGHRDQFLVYTGHSNVLAIPQEFLAKHTIYAPADTTDSRASLLAIEEDPTTQRRNDSTDPGASSPASSSSDKGGIDLNPNQIDLQTTGKGIEFGASSNDFSFMGIPCGEGDSACRKRYFENLETLPINGFTPMIFQIVPITNLPMFLGFADQRENPSGQETTQSTLDPMDFRSRFPLKEPEHISLLN